MAGTTSGGDDELISGINVTPLVDVALVLLIIFIVTASFLLRSSIPIELPKAATAEQSAAGLMVLGIRKDGRLFINGRQATIADLPAAVADARAKRTDPKREVSVFISADIGASYGAFASVVDRLRLEGVTEIAMDTNPVADGTAGAASAPSEPGGVAPPASEPGGVAPAPSDPGGAAPAPGEPGGVAPPAGEPAPSGPATGGLAPGEPGVTETTR